MKLKLLFSISILIIFLLSGLTTNLCAQKVWDKYTGNPVLLDGEAGEWDNHSAFIPRVIYHNNIYKMYYTGRQNDYYQIGYATSEDGINWTKDPGNPIIPLGTEGAWDRNRAATQILLINDTLHMWYQCWTPGNDNYSIGHGYSVDGLNWCLCSGPVLERGGGGVWDEAFVQGATVLYDGHLYHMWYGGSTNEEETMIGYATSSDGINWTKFSCNPVIELGAQGTFYDEKVFFPYVIYDDNKFKMWFTAYDGYYGRIGYAESLNRIEWAIYTYPIVDAGEWGGWDQEFPHAPCILKQENNYKMWYGGDWWSFMRIGYADGFEVVDVPIDYGTIQEGLAAAEEGEIILVDQGTYYENIDFEGKAVTIASNFIISGDTNFINNTIINGSNAKGPNQSVVRLVSGEDITSVLKGFTITGGKGSPSSFGEGVSGGGVFVAGSGATIENNKIVYNHINGNGHASSGGGIFADTCASKTIIIRNNVISDNTLMTTHSQNKYLTGGGISVNNSAIIQNNIITNNIINHYSKGQVLGGGIEAYQGKAIIENNLIKDNIAYTNSSSYYPYGGGIFCQEIDEGSSITGNQITGNRINAERARGGGIGVWANGGNLKIENNLITYNKAKYGAGIALELDVEVRFANNIIKGNNAYYSGGGLYLKDVKKDQEYDFTLVSKADVKPDFSSRADKLLPVIVNNTLIENSANSYGGGIFTGKLDGDLLAFNNILFNNTAGNAGNEIYLGSFAYLYNNAIDVDEIDGNYWKGKDNINIDPILTDEFGHLDWGSECANAGIPVIEVNGFWYKSPDIDFEGEERPYLNTNPDIGADEIPVLFVNLDEENENADSELLLLRAYPNPFKDEVTIEYELRKAETVTVTFYNHLGKQLNVISAQQQTGKHKLLWSPKALSDGIYYYRLKVGEKVVNGKFVRLN